MSGVFSMTLYNDCIAVMEITGWSLAEAYDYVEFARRLGIANPAGYLASRVGGD